MINRKDEHVKLAQKFSKNKKTSDFDNLKFVHNSLLEISLNDVSIKTEIAGIEMDFPFFINAMTGGSEKTKLINKGLAEVAQRTGIAMASGSLSAALKDESLKDSFEIIRKTNSKGILFANIGAEYGVAKALEAIEILDANALQIHLNVVQEMIMFEGDRDFTNWQTNIENIIKKVNVPVIVKEVGFGMSRETIEKLIYLGTKTIDISGTGGTNFASIENYRRENSEYDYLEEFGQSTVISLLEAQAFINKVDIIASGGIRNALDIVKSLALGAKAVGLSSFVLNLVLDSGVDKAVEKINSLKNEIKVLMTILGCSQISDLLKTEICISGTVKEWCEARKIDYKEFANRSV